MIPGTLNVLMVHNYYQSQSPSGENSSFTDEFNLLSSHGHRVISYNRHNNEIKDYHPWQRLALAKRAVWASDSREAIRKLMQEIKTDVAHFQNTFPLVSPSGYTACRELGVPVVQALRNYRLLCPAATFYRAGRICEDCLGKRVPWPGIVHACYRESVAQTAVVATMLTVHRWLKTWREQVDLYVTPSEFARRKFIEGGLPAEKIIVKPNFVHPDPYEREGSGDYTLFVGRLSWEKGAGTLLRAWEKVQSIPLTILGDGPLMPDAQRAVARKELCEVKLLGLRSREDTLVLLKKARFLIFPSESYETFGRVAIEAFACGVPVLASCLGAMEEIVEEGRTGLLFTPGDPEDLAAKADWAWTHPERMAEMGTEARREYEVKYTAEKNYHLLMEIYQRAIGART